MGIARRLGDQREIGRSAYFLGRMTYLLMGENDAGLGLFEEALGIGRELGDSWLIASALEGIGMGMKARGERGRARRLLEESVGLSRRTGDRDRAAWRLWLLGELALEDGDLSEARSRFAEMVALCRQVGQGSGLGLGLNTLGYVALLEGDLAGAKVLLQESVKAARKLESNAVNFCQSLWLAGLIEVAEGAFARSVRLLGCLDEGRRSRQLHLTPFNQQPLSVALADARSALGEEAFARAWAEGQAMTLEEAVDYALGDGTEE